MSKNIDYSMKRIKASYRLLVGYIKELLILLIYQLTFKDTDGYGYRYFLCNKCNHLFAVHDSQLLFETTEYKKHKKLGHIEQRKDTQCQTGK
jgi:hypothetical protein